MFFGTGALKNCVMLEFLFKKMPGLQACNFIEKRLQRRCFSVKLGKSFRASFLQNTSCSCLWEYLFNSLYCIWERWIMSLRGMYWLLFHVIACVWFLSISFFFFLFFCEFYYLLRHWGKFVNKAVELFIDSEVEFWRVSCFSLT